jgi:hypothetical protein
MKPEHLIGKVHYIYAPRDGQSKARKAYAMERAPVKRSAWVESAIGVLAALAVLAVVTLAHLVAS